MNRLITGLVFFALAPVSFINAATLNSELTRCAEMSRDLQRLACYDLLAGKASSSPVEALASQPEKASATKQEKVTVANSPDVPESTFGLMGSGAKSVPTTSETFGKKAQSSSMETLTSSIPGEFTGWEKGDKITLANGQVWKIVDTKKLYHKATNPEVSISKGMFDSYRINIKGMNRSTRVVRIK